MTYFLEFDRQALKEWQKLGHQTREQFKRKLSEIIHAPHIKANKLRNLANCYKIKLRASGFRLVYQVQDDRVVVLVVAVGKREKGDCYSNVDQRLNDSP